MGIPQGRCVEAIWCHLPAGGSSFASAKKSEEHQAGKSSTHHISPPLSAHLGASDMPPTPWNP